jgi:transcriptional regulator with XRE-family HTH domain
LFEVTPRDEPFGTLLLRYRSAANLTQDELAERAGLSVQAISLLERGRRRTPRTRTVEALASTLRLDARQRQEFIAAAQRSAASGAPVRGPGSSRTGMAPDPTEHFVGRAGELAELERRLRQGGRVAVYGLGGVGKTQLAARYLHRRQARYPDGAFWLRADEESALVGDLAGLAWHLGLPERDLPQQERQLAAVLSWLHEHRRWLLVLDNVEPAVQEATERLLPHALTGHVLLTSRTPLGRLRMRLEPLPLDTATGFLLHRTG